MVERRGRVEHEPSLAAVLLDERDGAVWVGGGFGMERDHGRTGLGEVRHDTIDRLDHEMHVDRRLDPVLAQRGADQRTDGEVRHVMVVHHVEMDPISAGGEHRVDLGSQASEVGGQDGGCDDGLLHRIGSSRLSLQKMGATLY